MDNFKSLKFFMNSYLFHQINHVAKMFDLFIVILESYSGFHCLTHIKTSLLKLKKQQQQKTQKTSLFNVTSYSR